MAQYFAAANQILIFGEALEQVTNPANLKRLFPNLDLAFALGKLRTILREDLVKVFSLSSIHVIVRMFTGFLSNKIVAVIVGPAGIALVGQLSNFSNAVFLLATGGINAGVTKYIAEYKGNEVLQRKYFRSAIGIVTVCSVMVGVPLIAFSSPISAYLFKNADYFSIISVFGVTIVFYGINSVLVATLNGFKEFSRVIKLNIVQSVNSLIFSMFLVYFWGVYGALLALVTNQSVVLLFSIKWISKSECLKWDLFEWRIDKAVMKHYAKYTLMAVVVAFSQPLSMILVRNRIIDHLSANAAGYWDGMNRLSEMYLLVFSVSLATYYLPRLSELSEKDQIRKEIFSTAKLIMPLVTCACVLVYFFRHLLVKILFSERFLPMEDLFSLQLAGDFLRIGGTLVGTLIMAKARVKLYILAVTLQFGGFLSLSYFLINLLGVKGVCLAYALSNLILLAFLVVVFKETIFYKKPHHES